MSKIVLDDRRTGQPWSFLAIYGLVGDAREQLNQSLSMVSTGVFLLIDKDCYERLTALS